MAERLQLFTFSIRERIAAAVGELLFLCDKVKVGEEVRDAVSDKVIVAGGDIFREFERSVVDWESRRSEQEIRMLYRVLGFILRPRVQLSRTVLPPEHQQLSVCKEELPPEQQKWSPSLGQEEPELPLIKEEEEELRVGQDAGITQFPSPPVPVKTEHDKECTQLSQLHQSQTEEKREAEPVASTSTEQMETEGDGEDWGVSEADSSLDPAAALEPAGAEQLFSSHSSETETEDSDEDWMEIRQPQSGYDSKRHPTNRGNKLYDCGQCGKTFKTRPEVKVHQRRHTGEKPYECEQCGKRFTLKGDLKRHLRIHTGEKPYDCEQCGKYFATRAEVKRHKRIHTGEKPYGCEQCGKRFRAKAEEQIHQRIHTGERPYPCEQCGKRFRRLTSLKIHQRIHTGEKPYSCEQCGKRFTTSGDVIVHQRSHTGEKPYLCEKCGKRFSKSSNLKKHKGTHTGETNQPTN